MIRPSVPGTPRAAADAGSALDGHRRPDPRSRAGRPAAWALYDFANTIFSYAIVSDRDRPVAHVRQRFGPGLGQLVQGIAIAVSVGINALVSPLLGALATGTAGACRSCSSSRSCTIVPSALIGPTPPVVGAILFTSPTSATSRR